MYCFDCEKEIKGNYITTSDGYAICDRCFRLNWFKCKICGEVCNKSELAKDNTCVYCEVIKDA